MARPRECWAPSFSSWLVSLAWLAPWVGFSCGVSLSPKSEQGCATIGAVQKTLKVFLFAGQSNMVGSDAHPEQIDDSPLFKGAGLPQADVRYTAAADGQTQGWGPLQPLRAFGPELTFARLVKKYDR